MMEIILLCCIIVLVRKFFKKRYNVVYDLKRDVDYRINVYGDNNEGSVTKPEVEILQGEFAGVIYSYGEVGEIAENADEESADIQFEYFVLNPNGHEELESNDAFINQVGEILVSMILSSAEERKQLDGILENMKIIDEEGNPVE